MMGSVAGSELAEYLAANLASVRERIASAAQVVGRDPDEVTLVAVTKTVDAEVIAAAHQLGVVDCGENRVQELAAKAAVLPPSIVWHLVGHLQTNKAKTAVQLCATIHSVDSTRVAQAISRHASELGKRVSILLEVNVSGEASKFGLREDEVRGVVAEVAALPGVSLDGLMTVAPLVEEPEAVRPVFRRLRTLRDTLRDAFPGLLLPQLSMGMTGDFEVAIQEGATMVRIGRAIFGERRR